MPSITLTPVIVKEYKCPEGRSKITLYDSKVTGLTLEIRNTGTSTYFFRYRNQRGTVKYHKIARSSDLSLNEARKIAQSKRTDLAMGKDPAEIRETLRKTPLFSEFIETYYIPHIKSYKRSWYTDISVIKNHLLPAFGSKYMDEISPMDVQKLYNTTRNKGYADATANKLGTFLGLMFKLAITKWEIPGVTINPVEKLTRVPDNNERDRYLSVDEIKRLQEAIKACPHSIIQPLIGFLLLTGARRGEALKAKWSEFDFYENVWRIPVTKAGKPRYVPLSDEAVALLGNLRKESSQDNPYVFPSPATGKPLVGIYRIWDIIRKDAGLPEVRIHDLRHTHASLLVNSGRSLYEVQRLLGHADASTTQRYAHLSQEVLRSASSVASSSIAGIFTETQQAHAA